MPSWNQLLDELEALPSDQAKTQWIRTKQGEAFSAIAGARDGRNVLMYASAFLQKPQLAGQTLQIMPEDINGFMSTIYGMDCSKGLTLLLHTPGGVTNAAETIVAYLWSKFSDVEVIIPTYAMSAGTMISLSADRIIMGRQSQLGPIDPQMQMGGRFVSARAIVDQFEQGKLQVLSDRNLAHVWAPILQTLGPALLQEAQYALKYGESMVAGWLEKRMYRSKLNPTDLAGRTAAYFNDASTHKSHGRRIDRDEARTQELNVIDLESDQQLQDAVLTLYHLATIIFEKSPTSKMIAGATRSWVKNAA